MSLYISFYVLIFYELQTYHAFVQIYSIRTQAYVHTCTGPAW